MIDLEERALGMAVIWAMAGAKKETRPRPRADVMTAIERRWRDDRRYSRCFRDKAGAKGGNHG
jgi:hypothetical protein